MNSIELLNVHPMWGGHNLWLQANGDGVLQMVARGGLEKRYRFHHADLAELHPLVEAASSPSPMRPGIPDETCIVIRIHLLDGQERAVRKWANDRHPPFDALLKWLNTLAQQVEARGEPPCYEGRYDYAWKPS